jgi:Domain of unknown function (DUF4355)
MADDDAPNVGGDEQQQQDGGQNTDQGRENTTRQEHERNVKQEAEDKGRTLTQAEVDKIVADRVARERKKFSDYDDLKKKAAKLQQIEDSQKTELEKLNDELGKAQVELQAFRVAEVRRQAASSVGLDPELAEFITAVDEDEAVAQAKRLLDRMGKSEKQRADLRQGTRQTPPPAMSRDSLLRGLAGYGSS